jgi:hypothetical protein
MYWNPERFGCGGVDAVKAKGQIIAALRPQLPVAMGRSTPEKALLCWIDLMTGE